MKILTFCKLRIVKYFDYLYASKKLSHTTNARILYTELSASIKREKIVEICEGCGQKIQDRYLMRVGELSWHEHCLSCCVCGCPLAHTCYTRNAKLYCKPDYDR